MPKNQKTNPEVAAALDRARLFAESAHTVNLDDATSGPYKIESDMPGRNAYQINEKSELFMKNPHVSDAAIGRAACAFPADKINKNPDAKEVAEFTLLVGGQIAELRKNYMLAA